MNSLKVVVDLRHSLHSRVNGEVSSSGLGWKGMSLGGIETLEGVTVEVSGGELGVTGWVVVGGEEVRGSLVLSSCSYCEVDWMVVAVVVGVVG